jgi:hypothetical protein
MFKTLRRAGIATALVVAALAASTSAEARDRYYRHHDGDTAGAAIAGGIIGLALGAAIASSDHDRYYYDGGYHYGRPRGYYYTYPRRYYHRAYPRHYYNPRHHHRGGWGWRGGHHRGW